MRGSRRPRAAAVALLGGAILLAGFLLSGSPAGGQAPSPVADPQILTIEMIGRPYWWDVWYRDALPSRNLRTANEIHIPVGQRVRIIVQDQGGSGSIRVPGLQRLIHRLPGRGPVILRASEPGTYRGGAGEPWRFGRPRMEFLVIARPPADFLAWWEEQLRPAPPPANPWLARGEHVFLSTGCSFCHAVRGTRAMGKVGPDLTHFGSRRTIAAGVVPNRRGHLGAWLVDPQQVKPGTLMPGIPVEGENLQALIGYLHSLR